MEGQDRFITLELDDAEVGLGEDCEEALADVGSNADLYVADLEGTDLINEAHMDCVSWVKMYFIFSRLVLTKRI